MLIKIFGLKIGPIWLPEKQQLYGFLFKVRDLASLW